MTPTNLSAGGDLVPETLAKYLALSRSHYKPNAYMQKTQFRCKGGINSESGISVDYLFVTSVNPLLSSGKKNRNDYRDSMQWLS